MIRRALVGLVAGAVAGAAAVMLLYALSPSITFDMSKYLPDLLPGFYEPEVANDKLFAWTAEEGRVVLRGLDRRVDWTCVVQMSGGMRPATEPKPAEVIASADGLVLARAVPEDGYSEFTVTVPARPQERGLDLSIRPDRWFQPGPQDQRHLGLVVSRIACAPAAGRWPLVPPAMVASAALGAGTAGVIAACLGGGLGATLLMALLVAVLQAFPATTMFAPYGDYAVRIRPIVLWAVVPAALLAGWLRFRRRSIRPSSLFVGLFSTGSFYLKLLALLHPAKDVVDAIFQAHRYEWVLAGRYYFTSVTPRGYKFPYAIGLYLVAAPFASLTDHVSLLRIIVLATWMAAGVMLYAAAARVWQDRFAGAAAAVMFNTVPVFYDIVGSANHPNAFGEAMGVIAVCALVLVVDRWRRPALMMPVVGLLVLTAFGSHLSTFATLAVTLGAACLAMWRWGSPDLRKRSVWAMVLVVVAVVLVVGLYYGHFIDVYTSQLNRVHAETGNRPASRNFVLVDPTQRRDVAPGSAPAAVPLWIRVAQPIVQAGVSFGWPLLPLAVAGGFILVRSRRRDPLSLTLAGWMTMFCAFLVLGIWTPVEMRYHLSASGAMSLLGGAAVSAAWKRGGYWRGVALALLGGCVAGALYICWTWVH